MPQPVNCKNCGEKNPPSAHGYMSRVYCSKDCSDKYYGIRQTPIVVNCKHCGEKNPPSTKNQRVYCSKECWSAFRRKGGGGFTSQAREGYGEASHKNAAAGVYEIENKITGKIYVGQSAAWKMRCNKHKNDLSRGNHHSPSLQADYNEHGLDAFDYRVIQEYPCDTSSDVLKEHERETLINRIREGREVYNNLC